MTCVSRETPFERYQAELLKWDRRIRLVGRSHQNGLQEDHVHDAELFIQHLDPGITVADVGTGNGLPIIPALLAAPVLPRRIILVESDARKAAFLRSLRRSLGLDLEILRSRIEQTPYLGADVVSAKAFAPLPSLLDLCAPHLAPRGRILAFKGKKAEEEIADARRTWDFDVEREGRNPRTGAVLLVIRNPRRRTPA